MPPLSPLSLRFVEQVSETYVLVLRLFDAFTKSDRLAGPVTAIVAAAENGFTAGDKGTFVFRTLAPGPHTIDVASVPEWPYYVPVSIPVTLPTSSAMWPAYPDQALANPARMLDDPLQPVAYRNQRAFAALRPSTRYPFPLDATLIRGTVRAGGNPLADATVFRVGSSDLSYVTGADGEFVLFIQTPPHDTQTVTVRATHLGKPDVDVSVDVRRAMTVATNIAMAP